MGEVRRHIEFLDTSGNGMKATLKLDGEIVKDGYLLSVDAQVGKPTKAIIGIMAPTLGVDIIAEAIIRVGDKHYRLVEIEDE